MHISVVIPVLNEQDSLPILCQEITAAFSGIAETDYEILIVDDGSTDETYAVATRLHEEDPRIKALQFRRNFGKAAALAAGFTNTRGEIIFTLDGDLQDDPAEIPHFLQVLNEGYDLVSGWKYPRLDPWTKTLPSKLYNAVLRLFSGIKLHDFDCGFKVYRRDVLNHLHLYGTMHRYIPVLAHWKGYRVGEKTIKHRPRSFGYSKFGVRRLFRGFFDFLTVVFLTEYGWRPLHLFGWAGLGSFGLGFLISVYLTVLWFSGEVIGNRPLLTLGVLLMIIGVQFFSIGLLAEMFVQSLARQEEPYVIRAKLV
ncbi:MAG: glycosyltransferase family 2 protein [Anaerolineae bacterium]|nr:glycosyltransferase family 2 protein [Anaerolineae bacterium]